MNLAEIQRALREEKLDAWVIWDFRGSNPILPRLLPGKRHLTRRVVLVIPSTGQAHLAVSPLDANQFQGVMLGDAPVAVEEYSGWRALHAWLGANLAGRVAMEYSPGNALPVMSQVDAGSVELVRSLGVEVVSSANLVQASAARWGGAALANHRKASDMVDEVKNEAFAHIGKALAAGSIIHEHDAARFIRDRFKALGLEWPDGPIVATNGHAGDPHFEPSERVPTVIRRGDLILIDLWARVPGDENVHADVTWMGFAGDTIPEQVQKAFETVIAARDAALALAQERWKASQGVQGWELDDAAMGVLKSRGFENGIKHRTGHSLSQGPLVHGLGMNLDNLETHDTRPMLTDTGFTIEPGVYFPEFGIRSEINVYVDAAQGPVVTSRIQREWIRV
ncbi:MAG: aminopeptidase P family protein [Phycisphaeraceae bacterium]|nr:aminopeptidase P family protein [Phycisphaeraceae bacterium]